MLSGNPEVERMAHPAPNDLIVSACAAIAGVLMLTSYRRTVIAGPLIALALIPAAAAIGAGVAAGRLQIAWSGLTRLALDALLILVLGAVVILVKQLTVHRRQPMV